MPDAVTHPTRQELIAFGLGKLPDAGEERSRQPPGVMRCLPPDRGNAAARLVCR